ALRGIAMAQLGDFARAKSLLKRAGRAFGPREAVARARCVVAEAEIALVARDLGWPQKALASAQATLEQHGDRLNAAHARYLEVRRLLLLGRLDAAERLLAGLNPIALPPAAQATHELVVAGIAIRRIRPSVARAALLRAEQAARAASIPALMAEVESAVATLNAPAARLIAHGETRSILLDAVETLLASDTVVIDACRTVVRRGDVIVPLVTRPVLFALVRTLAEAWPGDVSRSTLLVRAFGARHVDDSHRARLRVEIGRLRAELRPLLEITATRHGFVLAPRAHNLAVLAPPVEEPHARLLALLADGEAWSSSALAIALGASPRTIQRALEQLLSASKVQWVGHGRARRWLTPPIPGFPTHLLLPGPLPSS
ncbi:MAG TPA: helix-turn-helix domain-containing protein, partial [Devosia sp.]|nr:helix-turn-helix domain-containing protein [Devosia sp.]